MSSPVILGRPMHHYLTTTNDTPPLSPFYGVPHPICNQRATLRLPSSGFATLAPSLSPPSRPKHREKSAICASSFSAQPPLDLTEDNVKQVLDDARVELSQIFDGSVGITGKVELAELDGPFVKIGLRGRFWHKRSTVLARVGNYLKQRIPEILEVEIEDEKQLDDSPENF